MEKEGLEERTDGKMCKRVKEKLLRNLKSSQTSLLEIQCKALNLADRCYFCPIDTTYLALSGTSEMYLSTASNIGFPQIYQFYYYSSSPSNFSNHAPSTKRTHTNVSAARPHKCRLLRKYYLKDKWKMYILHLFLWLTNQFLRESQKRVIDWFL